jgi:hypothetical protein
MAAEREQARLREQAELTAQVLKVRLLLAQGKDAEAEQVMRRVPANLAFIDALYLVDFRHAIRDEWSEAAP